MSNNMAKIAEARKTVEQLKLEVNIERMKVPGLEAKSGRPGGLALGARPTTEGWVLRWADSGARPKQGRGLPGEVRSCGGGAL